MCGAKLNREHGLGGVFPNRRRGCCVSRCVFSNGNACEAMRAEQLHIISVAECLWPNGQYSTATMHMLSSSLQSRVTSQPPCCCQAGGLTGSKTTNIMLHRLAAKVVEAARQHIAAEAARKALEAQVEAETVAAAAVNGVCTLVAVHSCAHLAQVGLGSGPRSSVSVSDWSLDSCA